MFITNAGTDITACVTITARTGENEVSNIVVPNGTPGYEISAPMQKVAAAMRAGTWDTVLGPIAFDKKGDITGGGWAVYRWDKDGNYQEITEPGRT